MDLETDKLRCSKQELHTMVKSLGTAPIVEACSRFHTLTLRTQGSKYNSRTAPRSNVRIMIPYLGPEYTSYVGPESMMRSVGKRDVVVSLDAKAKPLGWEDDYPSFKTVTCVQMDPVEVRESLDFVLRLDQDECPPDVQGIVFSGGEILSTDRHSIHASLLSTPITEGPSLCGRGALETLRDLLSMPTPWSLEGFFRTPEPKKNRFDQGAFFFRLREPSGVQVEITSVPRVPSHDMKRGRDGSWARAPIDQHAICFSVASSFLQEICSYSRKKSHPMLTLRTKESALEYEATSEGAFKPAKERMGEIPVIWGSADRHKIQVTLDPEKLLAVLKKSTDEYVQFIVPPHPDSGFEFYEINPVYVNTNPKHFAVISQMLRGADRDRLNDLVRSRASSLAKRKADA